MPHTNAMVDGAVLRVLNARGRGNDIRPDGLIPVLDGVLRMRLSADEIRASLERLSTRGLVAVGERVSLRPAGDFGGAEGPGEICCVAMRDQLALDCPQHTDRSECPDVIVSYNPVFDEYGIPIRDGGASSIEIQHCPWCGRRLGPSQRDRWFEELEALGLDPSADPIPPAYKSPEWRLRRGRAWLVWRQDDNGNTAIVSSFPAPEVAAAEAERLEALGHKQTYWVAEE